MSRAVLITALMLGLCWPAWLAAGWLLEMMELFEFDLLGRVGFVFIVLSLAEAAMQRFRPKDGEIHG